MITEESKQKILQQVLADANDMDLPYPTDYLGFLLGKMIYLIEQSHQLDTAKLIEQKMAELEEKMAEKYKKKV